MSRMIDPGVVASRDAATILRKTGWSAERTVDISEWIRVLARDGNTGGWQ
jgi:hypothetical protein